MNKKVEKIIKALEAHEDMESIEILEELGTNSSDNEVRELTARALVRKNIHDSLKIVIINEGKGINDMSPVVAMSTVNEILALEDKSEVIRILDDTINMNSIEEIRDNAKSVKSLLSLSE
ncbi:MAG: hypothetical protein NC200_06600 [Candidatus Gastranaerophilales bacterium]|nr:hypothetical protein [Candidatus Gastranaerophilales bacterium]